MAYSDEQKAQRKKFVELKVTEIIQADLEFHKARGTSHTLSGNIAALALLMQDCFLDCDDDLHNDTIVDDYVLTRLNDEDDKEIARHAATQAERVAAKAKRNR